MNVVQPIRDPAMVERIETYLRDRLARDFMLFFLGTNTGLRISDLLSLKVSDFAGEHLVVIEKKTRKRKFIYITKRMRREVKRYSRDMQPGEFLFQSRKGSNQPLTRSGAYRMLRSVAEAHGLEHIGTHTLRKTFGYHFYQQTKNVAVLQKLFNHTRPDVTLRYIGVDQDEQDQALKEFRIY